MRETWNGFWKARNRRERSMLIAALAVCVFGGLYVLLIDPAVNGTSSLRKSLPLLRQQAAQMRQLAQQLSRQPAAPHEESVESEPAVPIALTRESVDASLKAAGLNATGVDVSESGMRLQFASVPPAGLIAWLEQAQAQQLSVSEAEIDIPAEGEMAKANVTLTKTEEERQ
jgi:general secretion pathway protein M